jgi:hypothetical protein
MESPTSYESLTPHSSTWHCRFEAKDGGAGERRPKPYGLDEETMIRQKKSTNEHRFIEEASSEQHRTEAKRTLTEEDER